MNSKTKKVNPFEIFGLTPQLVKSLNEETLYKVIRTLYRVYQTIYHPDKGGDPKKALEINLAFEKLNLDKNPEAFREYRKNYIKRLSRKSMMSRIEELEASNRKLSFKNELLKEKCWDFLVQSYRFFEEVFKENKVLKFIIFDLVLHLNFSHLKRVKKQTFFKEIYLFKDKVYKREGLEKHYREMTNYRYLGTIERSYIEPWSLLESNPLTEYGKYKNFILKDTFLQECLLFLKQEPRLNSYLFFYSLENPQRIILEGVLIKKEVLSTEEVLKGLTKFSIVKVEKKVYPESLSKEVLEL